MTMAKQLTMSNIKKDAKALDKMRKATIDGYELKIYENLTESRMDSAIGEFLKDFTEMQKNNSEAIIEVFTPYVYLLLIKHGTSLDIPNDVEGKIDALKMLSDLGIFVKILNEFTDEDMKRFAEKIKETSENLKEGLDYLESQIEETEFENEEEMEKLLQK